MMVKKYNRKESIITGDELSARISDMECLVGEIENQRSWQVAMDKIKEQIGELDDNWQYVNKDKFYEMQITKMGLLSVLGIAESWKQELVALKGELEVQQNPESIQDSDFDNEV